MEIYLDFIIIIFDETNTIIVIKYKQIDNHKVIQNIFEIDYCKECHNLLFGTLTREVIEEYVKGVKSIPANIKGVEMQKIFNYLVEKKELKKNTIILYRLIRK